MISSRLKTAFVALLWLPALALAAAPLVLSGPRQFQQTIDRLKDQPITPQAFAKMSAFAQTIYRLQLDPHNAPYDVWAASADRPYPGYFSYDAPSGTVNIRLNASAVGLEVFNYTLAIPTFGDAYAGLVPIALFASQQRRPRRYAQNPHDAPITVTHTEWHSYYVASEPNRAIYGHSFKLAPDQAKVLKDLRLVLEFQPVLLAGANRLVGQQEFKTEPRPGTPRSSRQLWHYLSARLLAFYVIDHKTRQIYYRANLQADASKP